VNVTTREMNGIYITEESLLKSEKLTEGKLFIIGKNAADSIHKMDDLGDDRRNRGFLKITQVPPNGWQFITVYYFDRVQILKDALLEWEELGKINGIIELEERGIIFSSDIEKMRYFKKNYFDCAISQQVPDFYLISRFDRIDALSKERYSIIFGPFDSDEYAYTPLEWRLLWEHSDAMYEAEQCCEDDEIEVKETYSGIDSLSLRPKIEQNNTVKVNEEQKTAGTTTSDPEKPKSEFWGNIRLIVFLSVFWGGLVLFYAVVGNPDSFPIISKLIVNIIAIVALFFVCSFLGGLVSDYLFHDKNESIITNFIRGLIVLALIFLFGWLSFDFSGMFDSRGAP